MKVGQPLVSVIIPVYNVSKYLGECLDSVIGQTYRNLEILCVNDGSTDNSLDIMKEYAERDSRVRVIDKPNGGYGHAVNRGLAEAEGDWIAIVEPDDFIESTMYEDLLELSASEDGTLMDIVKGSYWLYFDLEDGSNYISRPNLMNCMPQGCCELHIWKHPEVMKHHPSIWSAIYRRGFIEEKAIRMIEPKGAGWADNPWFFETMLQAKRVMWTPGAYYYYRQTNPEASSKLKDYHVPFDRLRDLRAIYSRFGIDEERPEHKGLVLALYQRSFNYICESTLDEFGFPEKDSELQALISEVFNSFKAELVLQPGNVSDKHRGYFRDFMGIHMNTIQNHKEAGSPVFSFVIPLQNDRWGIWTTLNSLIKQDYEEWEAILVDCDTQDRSGDIADELAAKDQRFKALHGVATIPEGYNLGLELSKGKYIKLLRPGVILPGKRDLSDTAKAVSSLSQTPDIVIHKNWFPASRIIEPGTNEQSMIFDVRGREADFVIAAFPTVYTRYFSKEFIERGKLKFADRNDNDGLGFCVKSIMEASNVAFVRARDIRTATRDELDRSSVHDESDMISFALGRYESIANAAECTPKASSWLVARSCMLVLMAIDIAKVGFARSGERYFNTLKNIFDTKYGLREMEPVDCANYLDYGVLREAFSKPYQEYVKERLGGNRLVLAGKEFEKYYREEYIESLHSDILKKDKAIKSYIDEIAALNRSLKKIEESGSYILSKSMSSTAKRVVPKSLRKSLVAKNLREGKDDL